MSTHIQVLLDVLHAKQMEISMLEADRDNTVRILLGDELYTKMSDFLNSKNNEIRTQEEQVKVMTEEVKELVIKEGKSVLGTFFHAVYNKPRISWDNKGLDGFMVAHPELSAFRSEGQPTVSLRRL